MLAKRVNISDQVYTAIKNDILSDVFDFGDSVSEQEYAERLKISRTPLREAIKKLEVEGIIERLPNGRLRVAMIDNTQIKEIYQIRIALENLILENTILDNEKIPAILETILEKNKNLIDKEDWKGAREVIREFSIAMLNDDRYSFTKKILKQYNFFITKLKAYSLVTPERIIQAYEEHCQIFNYIKEKNIEDLKKTNTTHLNNAVNATLKNVKENRIFISNK